jgi:predicted MPP superfamily phosphohydrolase
LRGPGLFTAIVLGATLLATFANCLLGIKILHITVKRSALIAFLLFNLLSVWGLTLAWSKALPGSELISRFCVFWFMGQIGLLPFLFLFSAAAIFTGENAAGFLRSIVSAVIVLVFALSAYGAFYESVTVTVARRELALPKLAPTADGFKLVQLTDLHIGMFFSLSDLRSLLTRVRAEQPDVVVITGDLIDDTAQVGAMAAILDEFSDSFPYGVYYVWGNHEYMRGYSPIAAGLAQSRVRVLKNESARLLAGERPLYLLGVDYSFARDPDVRSREYQAMIGAALKNTPADAAKILLSHHSAALDDAFASEIDLTLTGHTHGTQIGLFGRPLYKNAFKYIRGLYEQDGLYGYVSTGVSGWFPFRLGCPPEIAVFTLKSRLPAH